MEKPHYSIKKHKNSFIHKLSFVEGNVSLSENASIWPFAVLRGDEGKICIGKNTNVQDCCVLHGNVLIGDNVTIGHAAVLHSCTLGSNILIGMNSTVLDNAKIEDNVIIAAGSVVKPNSFLETGFLYAGNPAEKKRPLNEKDRALIKSSYKAYLEKIKKLKD